MLKRKITTSILIFGILFSCAWILDHKGKREFYIPGAEEFVEAIPNGILPVKNAPEVQAVDKQRVKVFKPREYIRIQSTL